MVKAARTRKTASKKKTSPKKKTGSKKKWSASVTKNSNALDLEPSIFKSGSAEKIAQSLKRSSARSKRKKGTPYQSAMSMLNFYINRAGNNLSARQKKTLETAKEKLRKIFHKEEQ